MRLYLALLFLGLCSVTMAQTEDKLLSIIEKELKREQEGFSKTSQPPYFISYSVEDAHAGQLTAGFGSLLRLDTSRYRVLSTVVRVGDYSFDNSHPMDDEDDPRLGLGEFRMGMTRLPLENQSDAIAYTIWRETQRAYGSALEQYKFKKSKKKEDPKALPDFDKGEAIQSIDPPLERESFDAEQWNARLRRLSALFNASPHAVDGEVSLQFGAERRYYVSSEGARIVQNRTFAYLTVRGSMRAVDGDIVKLHQSYFAFQPSGLPTDEVLTNAIKQMMTKLNQLRTAPLAEPYTGPAILHARAAGVFFHEIFGHRVEGHRMNNERDAQTFKDKLKEQILPTSLSVVFDPSLSSFKGQALNGYYRFDDQGIPGEKVRAVNRGVLESFLMSRTPTEHFPKSNGHGRAELGSSPVSRQSNLVVENEKPVSMDELRKLMLAECKKQGKLYGYLFMDVVGGFTTTDRYMPNAFNIFPTEVYRVYVDGRPDELVRGVDLIGTPLAMFAEIVAADGTPEVFTGFCGAESGSVPVTAISPSLYVRRIETQKKPNTEVIEMLLGRPDK